MIRLHRLNASEVAINAELIESVEGGANTVLILATGNRIIVKEGMADVIQRIIEYRRSVYVNAPYLPEFLKASEGKDPRRMSSSPQVPSKRNSEREKRHAR